MFQNLEDSIKIITTKQPMIVEIFLVPKLDGILSTTRGILVLRHATRSQSSTHKAPFGDALARLHDIRVIEPRCCHLLGTTDITVAAPPKAVSDLHLVSALIGGRALLVPEGELSPGLGHHGTLGSAGDVCSNQHG